MSLGKVSEFWASECDYGLQREVQQILRDCNPTNIITRKTGGGRKRYELVHPSVAYQASDGTVKWRSMEDGGSSVRRHRNWGAGASLAPLSPLAARPLLPGAGNTQAQDEVPSALQLHIHGQENRRAAREARQLLRKGLVQSERRVKLCKNGVAEPYSAEHVPLWDGTSRAASALAIEAPPANSPSSLRRDHAATPTPLAHHSRTTQRLGAVLPPITEDVVPPTAAAVADVLDGHASGRADPLASSTAEGLAPLPSLAQGTNNESLASFFFTQNGEAPTLDSPKATLPIIAAKHRGSRQSRPSDAHVSQLVPTKQLVTSGGLGDRPTESLVPLPAGPAPPPEEEVDYLATATAHMTLMKKFKQVSGAQILSRDYVRDGGPPRAQPSSLSSKLRTHPGFKAKLMSSMDTFYTEAKSTLDRKSAEQHVKYSKKYESLDVSGDQLPFRSTAAAILHHVEDVIHREEARSAKDEAFRRHMTTLNELRAFLKLQTLHPKVTVMLDYTESLFGVEKPPPGSEVFFKSTMALLDDLDLLFFDVVEACVHIGAVYTVPEQDVIDYTRKRAARFIFDRPAELLSQMAAIERSNNAPLLAGRHHVQQETSAAQSAAAS